MAYAALVALTALLFYMYLGYPLLLRLLAAVFPRRHRYDTRTEPTVTLVISCRNEEGVIAEKLENCFSLDYPPEKLDILVVSDCSTDGTDRIVTSFRERGVRLHRQEKRRGKTAGLNAAMGGVSSDIVVFSDANAMYDRQALRKLVRHFADDRIGYVVGHARYVDTATTAAGTSEGVYWDLEVRLKVWESAFSSVVGGDGAIYAIRRSLYETMQDDDINDFVNPLQIIAKGFRGIFDPEAFCTEHPAGDFTKEVGRKIRITNRSFNGILRVPATMNPFRVGRFAWQLVSHKLFRWFSPFVVLLHFAATAQAGWDLPFGYLTLFFTCSYGALALLGLVGWWQDRSGKRNPLFYFPYYLILMNVAMVVGIVIRLRGEVISVWETVRGSSSAGGNVAAFVPLLLTVMLFVTSGRIFQWLGVGSAALHATALLLSLILLYTYLGYPLAAAALARISPVTTRRDEQFLPCATLLIAAYNEEEHMEEKLKNALALDYPRDRLRIVVVSDGSTDGTVGIARSFADRGVMVREFPENRGKSAALNQAVAGIDSEVVVFSDANAMYEPEALRRLVRHFADPRVGAVSGKVTLCNGTVSYAAAENSYYGIEHFIQAQEGKSGAVIGGDGAMYAIRRELYVPPPDDTILDDFTIVMAVARSGYLVLHDPEARGYEQNRQEIGSEFRRKTRIVAGGFQCLITGMALPRKDQKRLWFKFISHKVLRWFSGLLSLLLLILLVEMGRGEESPILWLPVVLAGIAALGHLVPATRRFTPINLLHYLFMLKLAAMAGCYLGLTGGQKVTWKQS